MNNSFSVPFPGLFSRLVIGICPTYYLSIRSVGNPSSGFTDAHAARGQPNFSLYSRFFITLPISLTKSYFIIDSKPGTVVKSSVRVTNTGNISGTVDLYPVDASTAQTSGAVYLSKNDPRNDVGAWITLGMHQVTLNPGQSQDVPFQVIIPGNARSGQHLGGIVAENSAPEQTDTKTQNVTIGTFQVKVNTLTIVAIQVNLPGAPVEQLVGYEHPVWGRQWLSEDTGWTKQRWQRDAQALREPASR